MNHKLVYSEYYNCAHNMANCEWVNAQKSHDFELDMPITDDYLYVILHRDKDETMESWHKSTTPDQTIDDFTRYWSGYYDGFIHKWVKRQRENIIHFEYHEMAETKKKTVHEIIRNMGTFPDLIKLNQWEENENLIYSKI